MTILGSYMPIQLLALLVFLPLGIAFSMMLGAEFISRGRPVLSVEDDPNRPEVSVSAA